MSSAQIKDRVREQYTALLEAFSNLLRSARLPDEGGDAGARQGRVPGELMEVFAEKMLVACQALLGVVAELKRNALLNDVAGRNEEVATSAAEAAAEAAELQERFALLQRRIDAAMQLVPSLDPPAAEQAAAAGAAAAGAGQQLAAGQQGEAAMEM
ncbi:hypothetical protein ABPG77_010678 [Micractinium sp. CCAP 211/92]